jgi:hypothetical protein
LAPIEFHPSSATRCEKRHRTGVVYGRREESRYTTPTYFRLFHATSLRLVAREVERWVHLQSASGSIPDSATSPEGRCVEKTEVSGGSVA